MIKVCLLGGLGNQMFQYAAAKALALRHGVEVALDLSGFTSDPQRTFLLDRLQVPEADGGILTGASASWLYVHSLWRQRGNRVLNRLGFRGLPAPRGVYLEPHFHFDPAFETLGPNVALFGFFQSPCYFAGAEREIRRLFAAREAAGQGSADIARRIAASRRPVSLHIRRGDYVTSADAARVHGTLDASYYRRAIELIDPREETAADFFVFSDDAQAAEALIDFVPRERVVHVRGDAGKPWQDMALMASCHHHIIANSSFSWWGAWLNPREDKMVIAPRQWFAPAEMRSRNTCDLFPSSWILI